MTTAQLLSLWSDILADWGSLLSFGFVISVGLGAVRLIVSSIKGARR